MPTPRFGHHGGADSFYTALSKMHSVHKVGTPDYETSEVSTAEENSLWAWGFPVPPPPPPPPPRPAYRQQLELPHPHCGTVWTNEYGPDPTAGGAAVATSIHKAAAVAPAGQGIQTPTSEAVGPEVLAALAKLRVYAENPQASTPSSFQEQAHAARELQGDLDVSPARSPP